MKTAVAGSGSDLRELLDRIRDRIELENLIGRKVQLRRRGARYVGLCPFHAEKTPSFTVTPERGIFKCFGCGKSGDAITFLQETEGLDFWEAVRVLADEAGVDLPRRTRSDPKTTALRKAAREALSQARRLYAEALGGSAGRAAREYLASRSVPSELAREFSLGWAPAEPGWLGGRLRRAGLPTEALVLAGLVFEPERGASLRDRFWDRLMFPICDAAGRTVGFGGRYLPGSRAQERKLGKYVNSADGPFFPKSRLLYGMERLAAGLREDSRAPVLVCEGYLDVILLHQAGFKTAVAALGTALTPDHARRLRRFDRTVILLLDPDPAGRQAAVRGARLLLAEGLDVRVAELPEGQDPADLVASGKAEEVAQRLARSQDIIEWRLDSWSRMSDFRVPAVKARAASEMADWVAATPNPALADVWIRQASDRLGVTEESLRRLAPSGGGAAPKTAPAPAAPARLTPQQILARNEREIAAALLLDPSLLARHRVQITELELTDPVAGRVLKWCLDRRERELPFDLGRALEQFEGDPAMTWLAGLRHQEVGDPRIFLERALDSLPSNREKLRMWQRAAAPEPLTDEDLASYRRPVPLSHRTDRR